MGNLSSCWNKYIDQDFKNFKTRINQEMESSDYPIVEPMTVMDAIKNSIKGKIFADDSFYIADLSDVLQKYQIWKTKLPRVYPFYAVKCNSEPFLLKIMASLGIRFDCASKEEINCVLKAGAKPEDIIYAHPFKTLDYLHYAQSMHVDLMTFDCKSELLKIKSTYPDARLVIRLRTPNAPAAFPLNKKFGCDMNQVYQLLNLAYNLHMNVVGVSFHVGSLCLDPTAYARAIGLARKVFNMAEEIGLDFKLLDIGGGFPGHTGSSDLFNKMCCYINQGLEEHFPLKESYNIDVIAEPGCYFACSAFTLCTKIVGKKEIDADDQTNGESRAVKVMYYLNDGIYGAFADGIEKYFNRVRPLLSRSDVLQRTLKWSKLWGITCCSEDCIMEQCLLPEMEEGEHILFENMGAYSSCLASTFNGFQKPATRFIYSPKERIDRTSSHLPKAFASSTLSNYDEEPDSICDDDSNCDFCRHG